ncbi:MAG TPA: beta-propeller fold lactonase family protein [Thermoanaerobaculia bacterium]|nr:beta-propeller fold lactonase family protein [Thermoanaerobaculia bacterium]
MTLRLRHSWLSALILFLALLAPFAVPAQAATAPANLAVVDPTQQDLFAQLFLEASGPAKSFARDLLPGRGDNHLAWFPQQFLVPLANNATPGAPLPGYLVAVNGSVQPGPTTLGLAQGTGIAAATQSPSGNACYMADGTTNNLAAYHVDAETSLFTNVAGAPFATDSNPSGVAVEPGGRFLYAVNAGSQSVSIYSVNLTTQALTKIGTMPTSATHPQAINTTRQCVFVTNTGSGGYEVFAINAATGALSAVPGSPFGSHQATGVVRTPDGNFVYFSPVAPAGEIEGFFIDNATCALTAVPGSPFTAPAGAIIRVNADEPALYAAGSGSLQAYAIDPVTGSLSSLGAALPIDPDTGAMDVGPKGLLLFLSDLSNHKLRSVSLDPATGALKASTAPTAGPAGVQSMLLINENGGQLIGQGIAQNRANRTLGGAPPYTLALIGGALPAGLSIDSTGKITGTPTNLGQSSFAVRITDAVGASVSELRTLEVIAPPAAPAAPSNLTAAVVSASQVRLNWQDNAGQTAAFSVDLSQDGGPFVEVQAVKPQTTTALITDLSPDTSYTFRVRAFNAAGGAQDTTTATVITPALTPAACTASATGQCLLDGRFLVEALFQDGNGNAGLANVVPITTDTAYLWFFSSTNVEVVVKLVNGCGLGNHFWVFAGGLTNVHVILRVTDSLTGAVRYYEVPYGPPFTPIQDTNAFGTCAAKAAADADEAASEALRQSAIADVDAHLAALAAANLEARQEPATGQQPCTQNPTTMCLNNSRFQVQATFNAGASGSGSAQAVRLTSDTGYLWFFSSSNVEAIVKVLNGCGLNGSYWVFAGGLTNVAVTLTVTDTQSGQSRQYTNPANTTFQPIQDTSAFSTCP